MTWREAIAQVVTELTEDEMSRMGFGWGILMSDEHGTPIGQECDYELENLRVRVRELERALRDANNMCRSAYQVAANYVTADRTVAETNWRALRDRLRESLDRQATALATKPGGGA